MHMQVYGDLKVHQLQCINYSHQTVKFARFELFAVVLMKIQVL